MSVDATMLIAGVPALYLLGALFALLIKNLQRCWRMAEAVCVAALLIAVAALGNGVLAALAGAAVDAIGLGLTLLIGLLGWVVTRYSRQYLHGEQQQRRYIAALLLTLAAVAAVAGAHHLGWLVAAWAASSLSLHHLLTFYRDRRAAQIVAHKKFLASRLAELCLLAALLLLYAELNTLSLGAIAAQVATTTQLPWRLHAAAVLIAIAAILKSAQLPVHGWLIQVMEAPTPVSALLHAGIVNLGGFVLIRLATLLAAAPAAQALLVVVGSLTAVLAGLVMMTRVSIKVRLAWSTCAQMGFMLMECGLGLYDLAFLHLVAHSLYKAYAFLRAGESVLDFKRQMLLPIPAARAPVQKLCGHLAAAPLSIVIVAVSLQLWQSLLPQLAWSNIATLMLGLGLAPLLWSVRYLLRGLLATVALTQLYVVWHLLFMTVVPLHAAANSASSTGSASSAGLAIWVGCLFSALFALQAWLLAYPHGRLSRALYPWVYHGFYLDERFTRLTFRVWPIRLPLGGASIQSALHPATTHQTASSSTTHLPTAALRHPLPGENA